jgi:MerR family mercuric resistance operon transcriptional regulator
LVHTGEAAFSRGALAKVTGVNSETIRYYEGIRLLPEPHRSAGGHRIYDRSHLRRLRFIRRCRELGFSLNEVRTLLDPVDGGGYTCAEVRDRAAAHLKDVTRKIRDLQRMQRTLRTMIASCDGGSIPKCPIIDALFSE